jgi:uncharacterized membrane protein YphA (DoxX/SURF4 family)
MPNMKKRYDAGIVPATRTPLRAPAVVAVSSTIARRTFVGYGFMEHGFAKLAKGPDAFANILQAIGVPRPHFMAWSTILVEILGGLAVILGAFVTLASLRWLRFFW